MAAIPGIGELLVIARTPCYTEVYSSPHLITGPMHVGIRRRRPSPVTLLRTRFFLVVIVACDRPRVLKRTNAASGHPALFEPTRISLPNRPTVGRYRPLAKRPGDPNDDDLSIKTSGGDLKDV